MLCHYGREIKHYITASSGNEKQTAWVLDVAFCFLYVLHVLTWHKGDSGKNYNYINLKKERKMNKKERKRKRFCTEYQSSYKYLHHRYRHLYIFGWRDPTLQSNAFTELLCPLLYFQGSLGNWYVYYLFLFFFLFLFFSVSSVSLFVRVTGKFWHSSLTSV